ncbi:oxygenase MpaB family protein [Gordonia sp. ABSL1-1]|uniref:oxygenase MpaB family protein n=1 Tax=Gordonia sp. ABSL1-1 TaxID=3053923 RepID=UPI002573603A|nr:oxygenase MpaB family protein [Gordonia sp. ABSL1-1]MDL9936049.1 oxygenase MpaB family protein [Gordonia sp. ABSL1-1]
MPSASALTSRVKQTITDRLTDRYRLRGRLSSLDPAVDQVEIARELGTREFPWGITQALSFALFRTYAVPSIGDLLYKTGQFTEVTQKRYDDTVLLLDAPIEHGFDAPAGRAGVRRINQMHAMYDISNDDMLYVLSTFVVCPVEWVNAYEWRKLTDAEVTGLTNYYRTLGKHMAIKDIPETYADFEKFYVDYEVANFAYSADSLAVADATLDLLCTFAPYKFLPRSVVRRMSFALMDDRLREAFGYPKPSAVEIAAVRGGLKARGLAIRFFATPRAENIFGRQMPQVRGYGDGYQAEDLGTFAPKCPVPHAAS